MQPSSPARLYNVQNDAVHFHTGHLENKHQILMGVQFPEIVLVEFDTQGDYVRNVARDIPKQFLSVVNSVFQADETILTALMEDWQDEIGFTPGTISIRPFFLPDRSIGIADLPDHYQEFLDLPDDYEEERREELQEDVRLWNERGDFVLYWSEDYHLSRDGELESS